MLKGIYESMSMDMKPNHEEILWLIEQAEKVEEYEEVLRKISEGFVNGYSDEALVELYSEMASKVLGIKVIRY